MNLQLEGKRALVTGSTAGIGFAIARRLAGEGASVIVNGRTPERVEQAIRQIEHSEPRARVSGVAADLATAAGCTRLVEEVPTVDILVNNSLSDQWSRTPGGWRRGSRHPVSVEALHS